MDASALARELDNLEKSWSGLDWWLDFWTAVVVIGVAIELIVLMVEYLHDWRDFKRATIHSPGKPSRLIYGLGFLGAALVAIGVAGEFRIHTKAGRIEAEMPANALSLIGKLVVKTPSQSKYPFQFKGNKLIAVFVGVKPLPGVR